MFQSTRPARGATDQGAVINANIEVSIHAPRAGRDERAGPPGPAMTVSIHAPRAGRDI